jgi:transcriptional regulator with XRE-family HTH domain
MQQPKDIQARGQYPNHIKQCIKRQGYTLHEVADEVGISRRTLTSYVTGEVPTPRNYLEKIAYAIGCDIDELVIHPIRRSGTQFSSELLSSQKETTIPKSEQENTSTTILFASQITPHFLLDQTIEERLDTAESMIDLAWEAWFASRPKKAARELNKLLPKLEQMLHISALALHQLRIRELIIRCHGLLGAICLDTLENDTALFHYIHAHQLAAEMHDVNQTVTYLTLIGDVLRRQNKKLEAISHMEYARDQATTASQATRGHILQLLAYTYADTSREMEFERTIQEATDLLAFTGEARDTARKEFVPFEIYEIRGKASRDLGKPLDALEYFKLAEKSLKVEAVTPRWHALLDISKGQALCDAGNLTAGIDLAIQGFLLAYKCQSPRQMNRVRKLLKKLEKGPQKSERKVGELREVIYETYLQMDLEK